MRCMPALSWTAGSSACAVATKPAARTHMSLFKEPPKRKRQGHALPFLESEAGYFLSIFLSIFLLAFFSPFFLSIFFSILSPFLSPAPAWLAARAEPLTAVNIAATINAKSLLISFSCLVFEHGLTLFFALPGANNAPSAGRLTYAHASLWGFPLPAFY